MKRGVMLFLSISILLFACSLTEQTTSPSQQPIQTAIAGTQTAMAQIPGTQPIPTFALHPTDKPLPTATLLPTNEPLPTATLLPTTNPNLIRPGTYIVGKDISAGLYEGQAGTNSCYWERLKDVSGTLNSILANGNGIGQFYIRVNDTDYAFKTGCELMLLTSLPLPSAQMPTHIDFGMYLVGIDIQPCYIPRSISADIVLGKITKDVDGEL